MYISKDLIRRTIIVAVAMAIYFAFLSALAQAEITGAVGCNAGHLTILTSDKSAVWSVYPAEYSTSYAVSEDGKTLYFASPKQGKVTFFAASVIDGQPFLEQHSLYNGVEIPDDNVQPTPAPKPQPAPVIETLESAVKSAAKGRDAKELQALADSFEFVVSGIDRGVITTPVAARETFRAIWAQKGIEANEKALDDMIDLVELISTKVDNSTLKALRDDYETVAKALKDSIPAKAPAKKSIVKDKPKAEPKKAEPKEEVKDCPNGQCPTGNCPNGNCNKFQYYRWGY